MNTPLTIFFVFLISLGFGQNELVWHDNIEEALEISKKEKKPIMMFFTGSDWCGWCIRLQKEVFFKDEFTKWAEENVILLEIDFPRRKELAPDIKAQNRKLQSQFAIQGYPTVWFVSPDKDAQGNIQWVKRGRTGYVAGGPGPWISNANALLESK